MTGSVAGHASKVPLRTALRVGTRVRHEALHRQRDFAALAAGTLSAERYNALMRRLHDFYAAVDPEMSAACRRFLTESGGYDYRPRAPVIAGDLPPGTSAGPTVPPLAVPTVEALGGALYVLEGALLGASMLEAAARSLPWGPRNTGYWSWCRSEAPERWRRATALIGALDRGAAEREAVIAAANDTFAAFAASLEALGREEAA